jgi:hypothetical protein
MAKKVWSFELADGYHTVRLDHGFLDGRREITVDGIPLETSSRILDTGSVHHFEVSGVPCVLHIKRKAFSLDSKLYVNRKPV